MTTFYKKNHTERKILEHKLRRMVDPAKVADLNCDGRDLLLEVVDLKLRLSFVR